MEGFGGGAPKRADGVAKSLQMCRLCGGTTTSQFEKLVLNKYKVQFHRCADCHSLQSDHPFWLSETYADLRPVRDTGMAHRTMNCARWTSLLAPILGIDKDDACLDWGGGNGLFCRLMRDRGHNFLNYDKYTEPYYCIGFTADGTVQNSATMITAFEVFEHLPNPSVDLAELFSIDADAIFFSTILHRGQGEDWFYLAHEFGAHVFFYSSEGLRQIGARYGYHFVEGIELHLFVKQQPRRLKASWMSRRLIKHLLGRGYSRRLTPIIYDAWRARRAPRFYSADRANLEKHLFEP